MEALPRGDNAVRQRFTMSLRFTMGKVNNTHSAVIDTVDYNVPVRSGEANFKRLTFDLGLGWELPLGGDFYFYTEAKAFIPASDYPGEYIFVNKNAPFTGSLNAGLRILF